jgi:hypothetical protein
MIISSQLFESYLQCPTKCWLRSRAELPAANSYAEWSGSRNKTYLQDGLKRLLSDFPESDCVIAPPVAKNPKAFGHRRRPDGASAMLALRLGARHRPHGVSPATCV